MAVLARHILEIWKLIECFQIIISSMVLKRGKLASDRKVNFTPFMLKLR